MKKTTKIGIVICDRYHTCGGGKCFRSMKNREGAFSIYDKDEELEIVGYATCGGCPGGNIEYVPEEMIKNGVDVIHFATGMLVGYPPCNRIDYFKRFIQEKYGINVVVGTHPIPEKYYQTHMKLKTWESKVWQEIIEPTLSNEEIRLAYN
ncbi:MAG TPA: CGGC domain-containing protein [Bacteroidales bacterium]|nr:CGGC domain-containing protein [Bacteroidales bacterium]